MPKNTLLRSHPEQITTSWPSEIWRVVKGHDGYFVSNYGRVCSVDRVINNRKWLGQVLTPINLSKGHQYVYIGMRVRKRVHVLVLEAFVGPRPDGYDALHEDDNPAHNWLSNLRWGTRSANLYDAVRNGKKPLGEQMGNAKLTDEAVRFIHANPQMSNYRLGKQFSVSGAAIKQVRQGKTWKHIV